MKLTRERIGAVLLAIVVLVGMGVPATAFAPPQAGLSSVSDGPSTSAQQSPTNNSSGVNVTVGQQLSTIITVSSDEVRSDFENVAFELSVETEDDDERIEATEDRAEELRERAEDIREDYEEATEEYEEGELTKSEYAHRLATLNARATNLLESYDQFRQRVTELNSTNQSELEFNFTALNESLEGVDSVSGTGVAALLQQFTGESTGEIELETTNGLEIEIESEDGERSREFERPQDNDRNITVNESDALDTALGSLSTPENGTWELTELDVDEDDGVYEFEFALHGNGTTGEAEVDVDGSSGEVFSLEEEIDSKNEDEEWEEDDEDDDREEGDEENEEGEEDEADDDREENDEEDESGEEEEDSEDDEGDESEADEEDDEDDAEDGDESEDEE